MKKGGLSKFFKGAILGGGVPSGPAISDNIITNNSGVYGGGYTYTDPLDEAHRAPEIDLLVITGTLQEDEVLTAVATGFYSYTGRAEGTHTYQWYKADDQAGTNKTALGTASTYTLLTADVGEYVWVEVVVKEVGGDVDGLIVSLISLSAVLAAIAPNFVDGTVQDEADTILEVYMNGEITQLTDMTGWSVTVDDVADTITGFTFNDSTVRPVLTTAPTVGQVVKISYNGATGNLEVGGIEGGSFTDEVCNNRVDETYSTIVKWNNNYWGGNAGISTGNWNNFTGDPDGVGLLNENMDDDGGSATAIDFYQDVVGNAESTSADDTATTNFPQPTTPDGSRASFGVFANTGVEELGEYTVKGFSANQWVKFRILHGVKSSNFDHESYLKLVGIQTIEDRLDTDGVSDSFETTYELQADGSGEIALTYGTTYWAAQNEARFCALIFEF